jgi:MYXO-CTERM domain-containing protein
MWWVWQPWAGVGFFVLALVGLLVLAQRRKP